MNNINLKKGLIQRISLYEKILFDLYGPQKSIKTGLIPKSVLYSNLLYFNDFTKIHPRKFIYVYTPDVIHKKNSFFVKEDNLSNTDFSFFEKFSDQFRNNFLKNITKSNKIRSVFFDGNQCLYYGNKSKNDIIIHEFYTEKENFIIENENKKIPIDIMFRNLADNLCDSLELNSCVGIPGLFQLLRLKKIIVINSIGTQILETPFFQKNINILCQFFLKEDLQLSSIYHYYWGKIKEDYEYILENFEKIQLTHIYTNKQIDISINEFRNAPELYIAKVKENFNDSFFSKHYIFLNNGKYHFYK
ncbi:MAG: circularly permuted type 2 ATP-grasp protein [Alphaproteobacteria bacterium]|nr:circularly permuted type 2 ATP-grasp protein [Alphaproteobacteria bacterium]